MSWIVGQKEKIVVLGLFLFELNRPGHYDLGKTGE